MNDSRIKPAIEQLKAAKAYIESPENWTQGAMARRDLDGRKIMSSVVGGDCWCAVGALSRAGYDMEASGEPEALEALAVAAVAPTKLDKTGFPLNVEIAKFNDSHSHAEVMAAFDGAISALEAQL